MTDKMTLVYAKKTGHVLGFVTRESDPEATLQPEEVAGESLLVRFVGSPTAATFKAQFLVPAAELSVAVKNYDAVVVTKPRDYIIDESQQVAIPTLATTPAVNLTGNSRINVDVTTNVTAKTPVWIQVSSAIDPADTQVRPAEIIVGAHDIDIDLLPLDVGVHYVLALVAGHEATIKQITVP